VLGASDEPAITRMLWLRKVGPLDPAACTADARGKGVGSSVPAPELRADMSRLGRTLRVLAIAIWVICGSLGVATMGAGAYFSARTMGVVSGPAQLPSPQRAMSQLAVLHTAGPQEARSVHGLSPCRLSVLLYSHWAPANVSSAAYANPHPDAHPGRAQRSRRQPRGEVLTVGTLHPAPTRTLRSTLTWRIASIAETAHAL